MKKFLALLLALVMAFSLVACGGDKTPADDQQGDNNGDSQYPEYFAGMDQLIADAQAEGELTVYGSCEEEYLTAACQHFEELFGIKVNAQRLSTGEVQAKIEEENGNPSADVWFGGTTDPYNVCAAEGLLEPYAATNASHLIDDMYKDADGEVPALRAGHGRGALHHHPCGGVPGRLRRRADTPSDHGLF